MTSTFKGYSDFTAICVVDISECGAKYRERMQSAIVASSSAGSMLAVYAVIVIGQNAAQSLKHTGMHSLNDRESEQLLNLSLGFFKKHRVFSHPTAPTMTFS
ncbi:hypothetical protein PoB_003730900 [Plakobranchus ocellatus]|uniref:Uncharacterized protein n=1 Tax=Plakobranchus ocellatus TaxID=259542 RepID=A0AAV4ASL7_9GAST|nr:hypothetical protein PoB_003730900 [Plakobranchus ocellatus]